MNEINFKNIKDIEDYNVRFKCYNLLDDYQATFHIYKRNNDTIHYQIDFIISGTDYNTTIEGNQKSNEEIINEKYNNLENCFKEIGIKYIKEKISYNKLENKKINLINLI